MGNTRTKQDSSDLSDLLGRRFIVSTLSVPRVPGELQQELKDARGRAMYMQMRQRYARPVKPGTEPIPPAHE